MPPSKPTRPAARTVAKRRPEVSVEEKLAQLRQEIAEANAPIVAILGYTIPQLLLRYLRVFAQRPDIEVVRNVHGTPVSDKQLVRLRALLPPHIVACAAELGALEFTWVFKDKAAQRESFSAGYNGGRVNLTGFQGFRWHKKAADCSWPTFDSYAIFDNLVEEGNTQLSFEPGEKPTQAELLFSCSSEGDRAPMGTVNDYLTHGAKAGFVWYWPRSGYGEARAFTKRLFDSALPRDTPAATVIAALVEKGLTETEARGISSWLGDAAVILLPDPARL
jgi:hypothetical protein